MLHLTYIQLKRTLTKPHFPLLSTTTLNDYAIKNLKITLSLEIERGCKQLKEMSGPTPSRSPTDVVPSRLLEQMKLDGREAGEASSYPAADLAPVGKWRLLPRTRLFLKTHLGLIRNI